MNIIIPMAGKGQRFSKCGFSLPKPLIPVAGKAMYRHAVDCMPLDLATRLVFILHKNEFLDLLKEDIETHYAGSYPCSVVIQEQDSQGQAEAVFQSGSVLDLAQPSLVHNCDTFVSFNFSWTDLLKEDIEGALALFPSQEERWSYAQLDATQTLITDVQEKKVISFHASTGTYFFKSTQNLLKDIQTLFDKNLRENNEFYLSSVYRLMLNRQDRLKPVWVESTLCFGTPQDLVESLNQMLLKVSHDPR